MNFEDENYKHLLHIKRDQDTSRVKNKIFGTRALGLGLSKCMTHVHRILHDFNFKIWYGDYFRP